MITNKAIVASGHPTVSKAALEVINNGGNAYDAVIAAGFTSAVAEPALTSLGGGGFILARTNQGEEVLFDFFPDTPGLGEENKEIDTHFFPITVHFPSCDQIFNIGLGSVAVPANLKGFLHVHERLGRLPLKKVLEPAVYAARNGVELNYHQAYFLNLLNPIMTHSKDGCSLFAPHGKILKAADKLYNHHLADFMETLPAVGDYEFYCGAIAEKIINDMQNGGGLLTAVDLKTFQVIERTPLSIQYRNRRMLTNPPPSLGGTMISSTLHLLEKISLAKTPWGSPEHLCALTQVLLEIENFRNSVQFSSIELIKQWINKTSESVRLFCRGTTHISVIDNEGNAASMTTSNGEGSGYIVPGTGIMLNNMMGEDDLHPNGFHSSPAGEKISSMMSPTVLLKGNEVEMVLGSGGSKRIRTAIPQVISNVIDFDMSIDMAVQAPRIHWDGDLFQIEPGYPDKSIKTLKEQWPINLWEENNIYFGGVHAVLPGRNGAGDARRGGDSQTLTNT